MVDTSIQIALRPSMPTYADDKRAEHQGLRQRMLTGLWLDDLERALGRHLAPERRPAWGIPEISRNPYRSICQQVGGALYREVPTMGAPAGGEGLVAAMTGAGYWPLMQHASTDLVGLREIPIRADYSDRGGLVYRAIEPDRIYAEAMPENPDVPVRVDELQLRIGPSGQPAWVWEVLSIADLDAPVHAILDADRLRDVTGDYLPELDRGYQYRGGDGRPYLPIAWYHAERTGRLWDSWYGLEAVMGSLTVGVLLTFWVHGVKDASFSTVLLVNGLVGGTTVDEAGTKRRSQSITVEPGAFIEVAAADPEAGQPTAIQLQPGADPEKLIASISAFEAGLAEYAGVSPADLVRTHADPRSGISLSISREGLRSAQSRYEPQLRRGDLEMMGITAKVLNRATGTSYPESGYSIAYPSLPLSGEEMRAQREDLLAKIDAGLMSRVDAYLRLHPGLTREQSRSELERIRRENAEFSAVPI